MKPRPPRPQDDLPARLREIADSVDDWNAPICARVDLLAAANELERLQAKAKKRKTTR